MFPMSMKCPWALLGALLVALLAVAGPTAAQVPGVDPPPSTQRVEPCPPPAKQPPTGLPTLLRCIEFVFHPDGISSLEMGTYLYYIKRQRGSDSTTDTWVPYNEDEILEDWQRLWNTGFI